MNAQSKRKHKPHRQQPYDVAGNPDALLKLTTAGDLSGIGISTIYNRAKNDPSFPKLIRHGKRCTRIRAGDLTEWLKAQAAGVSE